MTERHVTPAEPDETPQVNTVRFSKLKSPKSEDADVFKKSAEEFKGYAGVDAVQKRRITNEFKKLRRGKSGVGSKVIHEEQDFITGYDTWDVVEPNYNLDYLAKLYEVSSTHYAACNAKVANIVGLGYKFVENSKTKRNLERMSDDPDKTKKTRRNLDVHRDSLYDKVEEWNEEDTFTETLAKVWRDYEVMGNGYLEIGRNDDGTIGYVGHIPAQTLRIRKKRDGFVQIAGFKVQFFGNFGDAYDEDGKVRLDENGKMVPIPNPVGGKSPNEVIHLKKYSPTSGYYGVPDIVSAANAVAGNEFAARFNLDYFENKAIPRYAIILKGAELGVEAEQRLLGFFDNMRGEHHRSVYIPLPPSTKENPVELELKAIETGVQDSSFSNYVQSNDTSILMAHRVPITKISVASGASVATARDADKTFKEQVCAPEQKVFEKKINRITKELSDAFEMKLNEMSLTDENTQSQIDERRRKTGEVTANENRARRGEPAIEGGDELYDMNAEIKLAEMADKTTRRGQDKQEATAREGAAQRASASAGANANGNPAGTRQRDTQRTANATDSAGEARNPKGDGRTTP